jgi:hypothetical protein
VDGVRPSRWVSEPRSPDVAAGETGDATLLSTLSLFSCDSPQFLYMAIEHEIMVTSKSDVLLTAGHVMKCREEDKQLDEKIRQLQQRRRETKRKLDAAGIFAGLPSVSAVDAAVPGANGHDSDESSDSAHLTLLANMRKTGESLKVQGIKARLIELGLGDSSRIITTAWPIGSPRAISSSCAVPNTGLCQIVHRKAKRRPLGPPLVTKTMASGMSSK